MEEKIEDLLDFIAYKKSIENSNKHGQVSEAIINGEAFLIEQVDEDSIIQYDIDPARIDILNEYYNTAEEIIQDFNEANTKDAMINSGFERMLRDELESWGDDWQNNID